MSGVVAAMRLRWGAGVVLVCFGCLVITGIMGVNFGFHWDEPTQLYLVNHTLASGSFLPDGWYHYPELTYLLSLFSVLSRFITGIGSHKFVAAAEFYLRTRSIFLIATALGGIWLYLGLRRRAGEMGAAFGAATYLLSFQLAYHARWIAPDAVLAMVAALFLWFLVIAWDAPESRWRMVLPAVAAGLATATKYQGAVLLVPVVVLFVKRWRDAPPTLATQVRGVIISVTVFVVTFLVITPGAVLQRSGFIASVSYENHHYRTTHGTFKGVTPYDIHDHLTYLWLLTRYVVISLPSQSPLISTLVIALAVLGLVTLAHREPLVAVAVILPGVIVALYYSTLVVFIVRNLLFMLPFLAFLAGVGVGRAAEFARTRVRFSVLATVLLVAMLVNGVGLAQAAESIIDASPATLVRESDAYMRGRPNQLFVVSGPLQKSFTAAGTTLPENARTKGRADYFMVLESQIRDGDFRLRFWPATLDGTYRVVGPEEVDFDFYPTWEGADRVLVMTPAEAHRFGLDRHKLSIGPCCGRVGVA
jgi:hypothetical protein